MKLLSGLIERAFQTSATDAFAALEFLERIRPLADDSGDFELAQAELLFKAGRRRDCKQLISEMAVRYSGLPALWLLAYRLSGAAPSSRRRSLCQAAIVLNPAMAAAYNDLGNSLIDQEPDLAEVLLERAHSLDPDLAEPCHNLGVLAERRDDWVAAKFMYREALLRDPNCVGARLGMGSAIRQGGDEQKALQFTMGGLLLEPENPAALIAMGIRSYQHYDFANTEIWYRRALQIDPDNSSALFNLSCFLLYHGDPSENLELSKRIKLPRLRGLAMLSVAEFSLEKENKSDAVRYSRLAHLACPKDALISHRSAFVLMQCECFVDASHLLEGCVSLLPTASAEWYNLAFIFQLLGKAEQAKRAVRISLRIRPAEPRLLSSAAALLRQLGDLKSAEECASHAIAREPGDAAAFKTMTAICLQRFQPEKAAYWALRTLRIDQSSLETLIMLGTACDQLSRSVTAVSAYQAAVAIDPISIRACYSLALSLRAVGNRAKAEELVSRILCIKDDHVPALSVMAVLLNERGEHDKAIEFFERAAYLSEENPAIHTNIGNTLFASGNFSEAVKRFQTAVSLNPTIALHHYNLGCALQAGNRATEAIRAYRDALALDSKHVSARFNLAWIFQMLGKQILARTLYQHCLIVDPAFTKAILNYIETNKFQQQEPLLIRWYARLTSLIDPKEPLMEVAEPEMLADGTRTLELTDAAESGLLAVDYLKPPRKEANVVAMSRWNAGLVALAVGRLREGWEGYEYRWESPGRGSRRFRQPQWNGSSVIAGKRLLVWREQGIGDEIMFANCLPDLVKTGTELSIEASPKLVKLFTRSFAPARVIPWNADNDPGRNDLDLHIPIGSLPRVFRKSVNDFPTEPGFLTPDSARTQYWRERLSEMGPPPYIGLSWRGKIRTLVRDQFYSAISDWESILATNAGTFINMQYDDASAEIAWAQEHFGITIHTPTGIDMWDDLDDVAALLGAIDLTISSGTAVFSLAAGVGRPVWLMWLENVENWPALGTRGLPWYPSVRLFAKKPEENWRRAAERIADTLDGWRFEWNEQMARQHRMA